MAAVSFERFVDKGYNLTGDPEEVPQLGAAGKAGLRNAKIYSTYQLLGHFLATGRNIEAFKKFLDDHGAPRSHSGRISKVLETRVQDVGIKLNVELSKQVVESSRLKDDEVTAFLARKFTGDLEHDFQKFGFGQPGKPSQSVKNLQDNGIGCTDALFGALLMKFDGPITSESSIKMHEFYEEIGKMGVANGSRATVVDALKRQLDIGIDSVGTPVPAKPAPVTEEDEPPRTPERPTKLPEGTDEQSRYAPRAPLRSDAAPAVAPAPAPAPAPPAAAPAPAPTSAPAPAPPPAPSTNYVPAAVAVAAVGIALYLVSTIFASPSDAVALV